MTIEKIFFAHLPIATKKGQGVVTAAIQILPDVTRLGFAFCAPSDSWDRKKGNRIAAGRLSRFNERHFPGADSRPNHPPAYPALEVGASEDWKEGSKVQARLREILRHVPFVPRWFRNGSFTAHDPR